MAVVSSCLSLLDLSHPPPWMELAAHFQLYKVFCSGRDVQCASGKGQTDPKQPLLNHLFSSQLLGMFWGGTWEQIPICVSVI